MYFTVKNLTRQRCFYIKVNYVHYVQSCKHLLIGKIHDATLGGLKRESLGVKAGVGGASQQR